MMMSQRIQRESPQPMQLLPGEVLRLLHKESLSVSPSSPLMGTPSLGPGWSSRNADDILKEIAELIEPSQIHEHLRALAEPSTIVEIRRGAHRQPPATFFACKGDSSASIFSVISLEPDGSCTIMLPSSYEALSAWTVKGLRDVPAPNIPLPQFPPLVPSGLMVVLALADLFRSIYPHPDPEWLPEEAIGFRLEHLSQILENGLAGRDRNSLVAGWATLAGRDFPAPNHQEIEGFLYLLANEGFLHLMFEDTNEEHFVMGESFTWAMRCLSWWDLTLSLNLQPGGQNLPPDDIAAIQATGIWEWKPVHPNPDQQIELEPIAGTDLEMEVKSFFDQVML